jgi:integrase
MREYVVNRPDEAALRRLLEGTQTGPEAMILRLALMEGLSREEIAGLTWDAVSFQEDRLELPDRTVPLSPELRPWLWRAWEARACSCVVASGRSGDRMQPESISRLARKALDRGGMAGVRLMDLRHDWIIRRLSELDWPTVARISGVEVPALQARFGKYIPEKRPAPRPAAAEVDEFKLWKVLQSEKSSPAGLALWLAWQMGLQAQEIIALTWDQVEADCIRLPDRTTPLTNTVRRLLQETRARRQPGADPHVLLTEQSQRPLDLPRLSRLTRAALIRGGMEHVRLMDLRKNAGRESGDAVLLDRVLTQGSISRGDVMELLGLSKTAAYSRLHRLTEQKRLVRVGGKYYLPGTVVPPEEQAAVVRAYLEREGFAYRQDLAAVLRVEGRQCALILKHLVEAGELVQQGQKYLLPEAALLEM